MDELAILLVNSANNSAVCEELLEGYCRNPWLYGSFNDQRPPTVLTYFLKGVSSSLFRRLFHVNRETMCLIAKEIKETKFFRSSLLNSYPDSQLVDFVSICVLYMNTCLSVRCCSKFCGLNTETVENYINLFNKLMGELKDDIVRFPALEKQNLLMVNAKRFFPGAVGVVDTVFIPKMSSTDTVGGFSKTERKQGVKVLVVVGRDGRFFNIHISENGGQSNCALYNDSALGYTLRYRKRSLLNRGSFLIADRTFPELPYLQIPFSSSEIAASPNPTTLSNYNYWHHKARFVAQRSIQRWLYRCPKCRNGLPYTSSRNCMIFTISSLILHQLCCLLNDDWVDDDGKIKCVVIASKDGEENSQVNEECYKCFDSADGLNGNVPENDYYDLKNMSIVQRSKNGEEVNEALLNSTYEKLKVVARKRRDFLVDLVSLFPNRSVTFYDD